MGSPFAVASCDQPRGLDALADKMNSDGLCAFLAEPEVIGVAADEVAVSADLYLTNARVLLELVPQRRQV